MNQPRSISCLMLLFLLAASAVLASPSHTGALGVPANRIVGLWSTAGLVGPCGGVATNPTGNTLLFHAGGTIVENPWFPPAGVSDVFGVPGNHQRNQALGTWSYDPATKRYSIHLRFDWFVDNAYHGYMTIDRDLKLRKNGMQGSGPVWVARFTADGTQTLQLCGEATSTRL